MHTDSSIMLHLFRRVNAIDIIIMTILKDLISVIAKPYNMDVRVCVKFVYRLQ